MTRPSTILTVTHLSLPRSKRLRPLSFALLRRAPSGEGLHLNTQASSAWRYWSGTGESEKHRLRRLIALLRVI
jgi:hypothetical protein